MSTPTATLTREQIDAALTVVAKWLGPQMGYDGPAPTGEAAAYSARGPMLIPEWDWPGTPTPTILLEGGPEDWAYRCADDAKVRKALHKLGMWAQPYACYALCLYAE